MKNYFHKYLAYLGIVYILLFNLTPAYALDTDLQVWSINQLNSIFRDGSKIQLEFQPRFQDHVGRTGQLLLGSAYIYPLNNLWSLAGGYLWTPIFPKGEVNLLDEHRLWLEASYRHNGEIFQGLLQRYRLENRFIEHVDGDSLRFRYGLKYEKPFISWIEGLGYSIFNEVFLNIPSTKNGPKDGFDRDRLFLGVYKVINHMRVDVGYMPEYVHHPGILDDSLNHNFFLQFSYSFKAYN